MFHVDLNHTCFIFVSHHTVLVNYHRFPSKVKSAEITLFEILSTPPLPIFTICCGFLILHAIQIDWSWIPGACIANVRHCWRYYGSVVAESIICITIKVTPWHELYFKAKGKGNICLLCLFGVEMVVIITYIWGWWQLISRIIHRGIN